MNRKLLSLIYPNRCPVCDGIPDCGAVICTDCEKKLAYLAEPVCRKCGKPLEEERQEYCFDCRRAPHVFDSGRALFLYQGAVKDSLRRFKYGNRREYAYFYAEETARRYGGWIRRMGVEAVVPIPLHKRRKRERGYNQAEIYARHLGKLLSLPVEPDLLIRVKQTVPQKELNDVQRKNNLKKAFKCGKNIVQFKKILLVDDIYTTGSTMDAAGEVLINMGVQKVFFACVSIGRGL